MLESHDSGLKELLVELHAADIAEILTYFNIEEVLQLLDALPREILSGILIYLDEDIRAEILETLSGSEIAQLVSDNMNTDDAVDIISELSEEKKHDAVSYTHLTLPTNREV